jgi:hypothetical protein
LIAAHPIDNGAFFNLPFFQIPGSFNRHFRSGGWVFA